jgi:holin-like protein
MSLRSNSETANLNAELHRLAPDRPALEISEMRRLSGELLPKSPSDWPLLGRINPMSFPSDISPPTGFILYSAAGAIAPVGDAGQVRRAPPWILRQISIGALQILGLVTLNFAGIRAVEKMALPIPGNLVGMVLLYAFLALGIVKLSWFEAAGCFLIRHLAFFFVPITVGLMDAGSLFASRGVGIILTLAASAAIGVMLAGWISQLLLSESCRTGGAS